MYSCGVYKSIIIMYAFEYMCSSTAGTLDLFAIITQTIVGS